MTIKKKIAAVAAAAMMAMSMTAISASAAGNIKTDSKEIKGYNAYFTLEAIVEEHNQIAVTYYDCAGDGSKYPEVRTHLHVDDYYTGALLGEQKTTGNGAYPFAEAVVHCCEPKISLFSAHEVYPDGVKGWGYYYSLSGVDNEHEEEH